MAFIVDPSGADGDRATRSKGCLSNRTALAISNSLRLQRNAGVALMANNQLPKVVLGVKFTDGVEIVRSLAQVAAA